MKKTSILKTCVTTGIFLIIAVTMLLVYLKLKPQTIEGAKQIAVEVVIPEEDSQVFSIDTSSEYLGEALEESHLVKGTEGEYGLFITEVNNRAADDAKQEWWCITKNGEYVYTGADQTPITDGDHFELTLTAGY